MELHMATRKVSELLRPEGFLKSALKDAELRARFVKSKRKPDRWDCIIQVYREKLSEILAQAKRGRWTNPYLLHWKRHATPTEWIAWEAIRMNGRLVLYPEFPPAPDNFRCLVDFANPLLKIGLEIDGSNHDPDKDKERDEHLSKLGWRIFRAPYTMSLARRDPPQSLAGDLDDDQYQGLKDWMLNSIDGLVEAIRIFYFTDKEEYTFTSDKRRDLWDCAYHTLDAHRLVDFPLDPDWRLPKNSIYRRGASLA
jgi:hypothetical protein